MEQCWPHSPFLPTWLNPLPIGLKLLVATGIAPETEAGQRIVGNPENIRAIRLADGLSTVGVYNFL